MKEEFNSIQSESKPWLSLFFKYSLTSPYGHLSITDSSSRLVPEMPKIMHSLPL